jgi:hypothetical protein
LVWLERTLLDHVHDRTKTDGWVLLAFSVAHRNAQRTTGVARCLAYTHLTELARQYVPRNMQNWTKLVEDLIVNHGHLRDDILGQASLCRLAGTTDGTTTLAETINHVKNQTRADTITDLSAQQIIATLVNKQPEFDQKALVWRHGEATIMCFWNMGGSTVFLDKGNGWECSTNGVRLSNSADGMALAWTDDVSFLIPKASTNRIHAYFAKVHKKQWINAQIAYLNWYTTDYFESVGI